MRTTVRLDEQLLAKAKQYAHENGKTLTSVIEETAQHQVRVTIGLV
ncbi:MAG: DUF6364 family protein [Gammaproteobacteria bacterium]